MPYFDYGNFGTGAADRFTGQPMWGSGETSNSLVQGVTQGTELFRQNFRNLLGRDPTPDELGSYQVNALASSLPNGQNPGYGDLSGTANSYIQNQFGPEAAKYQKQQQVSELGNSQDLIQNVIDKTMRNTASQFNDPNSQLYQKFSGQMNNLGISPSSGAFQAGAGSTIANSGMGASNAALQSIGIPGIQNIMGLQSVPYQQSFQSGQGAMEDLNSIRNFNMSAILARQLAQDAQPSSSQNALGMATGAAGGAGSLLQGGAAAKNATPSYVCREMLKRGLLCESDLEDFYLHMFDAVWYKARAFWHYKINGQKLVDSVNAKGLDWAVFKPLLFDRVMNEKDPCKANDLFSDACHQLCISAAPELWDERVFRTSRFDSLPFLPLLFTDATFGKNFWRILRIKMMWLYDKPRCGIHQ